jgi:hypothetical protein
VLLIFKKRKKLRGFQTTLSSPTPSHFFSPSFSLLLAILSPLFLDSFIPFLILGYQCQSREHHFVADSSPNLTKMQFLEAELGVHSSAWQRHMAHTFAHYFCAVFGQCRNEISRVPHSPTQQGLLKVESKHEAPGPHQYARSSTVRRACVQTHKSG